MGVDDSLPTLYTFAKSVEHKSVRWTTERVVTPLLGHMSRAIPSWWIDCSKGDAKTANGP